MKNRLEYILFRLFVNIQAITPFWLMYLKSDVAAFLMYSVFGYRKKVVQRNLERSFPQKDTKELKAIQKRFYRHLTDVFFVNRRTIPWPPEPLRNLVAKSILGYMHLEDYIYDQKKSV